MLKQNRTAAAMDELLPGKIRKRGCSSSASSSSSVIQNYRFKRAILVGKRTGSTTPVPMWKLMGSTRTPSSASRRLGSPNYAASLHGGGGSKGIKQQQQQGPVSARKLAATLWEMNEVPSPRRPETVGSVERRLRKEGKARERTVAAAARSVHSGSLPPHLSDPSHSPVSERGDRSGTGSRHRRASSISQKLRLMEHQSVAPFDSVSNASFMEVESRSRVQTPTGSTTTNVVTKTRLKDISNALTTSKELLKIINRVWGTEQRPSSSMSLISALHAELERARLQVNQFIHEHRADQNEINFLMKCFAEEKAAWKNKEQKLVEAAIESVAGELEVEKKLRRRLESLNKKLGKELADTKASLADAVKELEHEKRARAVIEHVCDELANDIGADHKAEAEEMKRESTKLYEEVEKEREMMQLADVLREERVQMKLSEAKHQLEEKNAAVDKLRGQLEVFLGGAKTAAALKEKGRAYLSRAHFASYGDEVDGEGEVENGEVCEDLDTGESDLHSIELGMDMSKRSYNFPYPSGTPRDPRRVKNEEEEIKYRKSIPGRVSRSSSSLQRSVSDVAEWNGKNERDGLERGRFSEFLRSPHGNGYGEDVYGYQSMKGRRDLLLCGSGVETARSYGSPTRHLVQHQARLSGQDRPPTVTGIISKSRLSETRTEAQSSGRKSRR
ncbi:unnamed protein product [Linum tenue]|uniref:Uncharacterized protein n=1 Tax=Linum tenue TaxID=586396 RepID=A0AAV0I1E9_9ROSI|nr:unnamed protein product [Linum tenue]